MILTILVIYLIGVYVCVHFIAQDVQKELLNQGYFSDFNNILLRVLKSNKGIALFSWLGLIYYLLEE